MHLASPLEFVDVLFMFAKKKFIIPSGPTHFTIRCAASPPWTLTHMFAKKSLLLLRNNAHAFS
jgi:hypothetical protein